MTDWRNEPLEDAPLAAAERREQFKDDMTRVGLLNIPPPPADNEDMATPTETFSVELHPTQANVAYVKLGNLQGLVRYDNLVYAVGVLALHRMKRLDGLVESGFSQAD